jgi:ferritin-like metal-binding protein YciE
MFRRFDTPEELFTHRLGSALRMENTVLRMLWQLEADAKRDELKRQLRLHTLATVVHVRKLEEAFTLLGREREEKPCPVMGAIDKEVRATVKRTRGRLVDSVILAGAAQAEQHEIAVYDWLIARAEAMKCSEVTGLLRENLVDEQRALEQVRIAARSVAGGLDRCAA